MNAALLATYARRTAPAGLALDPYGRPFTFEQLPRAIDIASVVDELSRRFHGTNGVVSIGDGLFADGQRIVVFTDDDASAARRAIPAAWRGYPVEFRSRVSILPLAYAPSGLAYAPAGDALSDALGPLLSSGALDRTVDRLGNILIDRLLAQPAVQREVGGAIGKAAVNELSRGVGKPYFVGLTVAAGVSALALAALATAYIVKK